MTNKVTLLASLAVLALATPALADANQSVKASGTDAAGTSTSVDQSVKVKGNMDGTTDTTVTTEATKDPKGLLNKSKVKTKETVTTDQNGAVIKGSKTVDGKVVEEHK